MAFPSLFPNEILLAIFALSSPRALASISRASFLFLQPSNPLLYREPLEIVIRQASQLQLLFALPETSPPLQLQSRPFNLQTLSLDRIQTVRIISLLGKPSRAIGRGPVVRTELKVETLIVEDPFLLLDSSITVSGLKCQRLVVDCRTSSNKAWTEFTKAYKYQNDLPYRACKEVFLLGGEILRDRYPNRMRGTIPLPVPSYHLRGTPIRYVFLPRRDLNQSNPSWKGIHRRFAASRQTMITDVISNGNYFVGMAGKVVVEVDGEVEKEWVESGFEESSYTPAQKRVFRVAVRETKDLWAEVE